MAQVNHFREFGVLYVVGVIIAALIAVLVAAAIADTENTSRLMAQCQADGHKEYECVSMLRKSETTVVPMPIAIPVGR